MNQEESAMPGPGLHEGACRRMSYFYTFSTVREGSTKAVFHCDELLHSAGLRRAVGAGPDDNALSSGAPFVLHTFGGVFEGMDKY
jgi:hypothetical protein